MPCQDQPPPPPPPPPPQQPPPPPPADGPNAQLQTYSMVDENGFVWFSANMERPIQVQRVMTDSLVQEIVCLWLRQAGGPPN
jgi:hypothetical protein